MSSVRTADPKRHASLSDGRSQMRAIGTIIENVADTLVARGHNGSDRVQQPAEGLREIALRASREAERRALEDVLHRVDWNRAAESRILRVGYKALLHKIVECRLTPPPRRQSATRRAGGSSR